MKVILLESVRRLGKEGDVAEVKDGYARNYLIPGGYALQAREDSFKRIEEVKKKRDKAVEKEKEVFLKVKERIEKISLTITVEAKDDDELYGAINEAQILKSLKTEGLDLESGKLILDQPIRKLGVYNLKVSLHSDIDATFRIWVVRK